MATNQRPEPVVVDGKSWGTRCRERRLDLGLKQSDVAELTGHEQQTISKIENDEIRPRDTTKEVLARALGTHVGELFPWPRPTTSVA